MRYFSKLAACLCCIVFSSQAFAAPSDVYRMQPDEGSFVSRKFMNYVFYGIGAGTLVGIAAITGFRRNFAENVDVGNVWRGASYGLYGGILLGLLATAESDSPSEQRENNYTKDERTESDLVLNRMKAKYQRHPFIWPTVSPVGASGNIDGVALVWQVELP